MLGTVRVEIFGLEKLLHYHEMRWISNKVQKLLLSSAQVGSSATIDGCFP